VVCGVRRSGRSMQRLPDPLRHFEHDGRSSSPRPEPPAILRHNKRACRIGFGIPWLINHERIGVVFRYVSLLATTSSAGDSDNRAAKLASLQSKDWIPDLRSGMDRGWSFR